MRVLLVGSGGREHALAWALRRSPELTELHAAPGNPGIGALARLHPVAVSDLEGLTRLAVDIHADLVVIGPEAPLVAGLADRLAGAGVLAFGPSAAAARLEGSKAFAKTVMDAAGVPTARFTVCDTVSAAHAAIAEAPGRCGGEGRRPGCRQGRGGLLVDRRGPGCGHRGACGRALRRRRPARADRGAAGRGGALAACAVRRRARAPARSGARLQACQRWRSRRQHGRDGLHLAGAGRRRWRRRRHRRAGAPADHQRARPAGSALPRLSLRGSHPDR